MGPGNASYHLMPMSTITQLIARFLLREEIHMARTLAEMQSDLASVATDLTTIKAGVADLNTKADAQAKQIADLQAQLAAGSPISQADLDGLAASADDLKSVADTLAQSLTPPTVEPPAPTV